MPRLSVKLSDEAHAQLSVISIQNKESMSNVASQLVGLGIKHLGNENSMSSSKLEKHCQQLIIQMNALIKNLSVEILKFDQKDFEQLREATAVKYNELLGSSETS